MNSHRLSRNRELCLVNSAMNPTMHFLEILPRRTYTKTRAIRFTLFLHVHHQNSSELEATSSSPSTRTPCSFQETPGPADWRAHSIITLRFPGVPLLRPIPSMPTGRTGSPPSAWAHEGAHKGLGRLSCVFYLYAASSTPCRLLLDECEPWHRGD
jgi:hypothetical protein